MGRLDLRPHARCGVVSGHVVYGLEIGQVSALAMDTLGPGDRRTPPPAVGATFTGRLLVPGAVPEYVTPAPSPHTEHAHTRTDGC